MSAPVSIDEGATDVNSSTKTDTQIGANSDGQLPTNLAQINGAAGANGASGGNGGSAGAADTSTPGSTPNGGAGGGSPPTNGAAGASGAGAGGASATPPVNTTPDIPCPTGAFFCSGFEGATFPAGTANIIGGSQFPDAFQLDTTQVHSGQQSLFLPLTSQAFSYRVLAIPVNTQSFWARLFVRFDAKFGDDGHDGLFAISTGDLTVDNNNETRIEFAEQEGSIVFNRSTDQVTFPSARPQTLAPNAWHCVEARFDGNKGDLEVFAEGQPLIGTLGQASYKITVKTFRIGTLQFHEPRTVWFDDVVLAADRVGCN